MDFGERSQAYVPLVLHEWRALTRARGTWADMPLDDLLGELPTVVRALLAEVLRRESGATEGDGTAVLMEAAARHGAFRRAQGCAATVIADDYDALRRAIRSTLRTGGIAVNRMAGVLYETLVALRVATRASLREFTESEPAEFGEQPFGEEGT